MTSKHAVPRSRAGADRAGPWAPAAVTDEPPPCLAGAPGPSRHSLTAAPQTNPRQVREGRNHSSRVIKNCKDPVFDEEFYLVVDDLKDQSLTIKVGRV